MKWSTLECNKSLLNFLNEKEIWFFNFRINAIETELKQTNTLNNQMKKDDKDLKQVRFYWNIKKDKL